MFTSPPTASTIDFADEINFWSRQLAEHALFLQLGLVDTPLKIRAQELHEQWQQLHNTLSKLPVREAAAEALRLAIELRGLQNHLLERQAKGQWIGWLWPLFIDHTRREGDYFIGRLQHKMLSSENECQTWLTFMAEHAAFTAHLLDPTEGGSIQRATGFITEFERLRGGCAALNGQLLEFTEKAGVGLDNYLKNLGVGTPQLKSIIHPVLAEHVMREGQRFLQEVRRLKNSLATGTL